MAAQGSRSLLGWLGDRDALVRRFVLAEVLGPPRALARPEGAPLPERMRPSGAAPAGAEGRQDPARGGAPPQK